MPDVPGYGRLIRAEFDHSDSVESSFPFDASKQLYSMFVAEEDPFPNLS